MPVIGGPPIIAVNAPLAFTRLAFGIEEGQRRTRAIFVERVDRGVDIAVRRNAFALCIEITVNLAPGLVAYTDLGGEPDETVPDPIVPDRLVADLIDDPAQPPLIIIVKFIVGDPGSKLRIDRMNAAISRKRRLAEHDVTVLIRLCSGTRSGHERGSDQGRERNPCHGHSILCIDRCLFRSGEDTLPGGMGRNENLD